MMQRTSLLGLLVGGMSSLALLLSLPGCGSHGAGTGPDDDDPTPGARVYVDASYAGVEDGTEEHPYNTIEEGIDAAERGGVVLLAAGTYTPAGDVAVPRPMTITGAGASVTAVEASIRVTAGPDTIPVLVKRLSCSDIRFTLDAPAFAPLVVDSCVVDWGGISDPPNHSYTLRNSAVLGDIGFAHAHSDSAWHLVEDCVVGGNVEFRHASGNVVNTLENCVIAGLVIIGAGSETPPYPTFHITGNTVNGIYYVSYPVHTTIAWNTLPSGDIYDGSDGTGTIDDQIIEHNTLLDGHIELRCAYATVRYNTITDSRDTVGILAYSGTPTNIIGNTITLPYSVPLGESWGWNAVGLKLFCGGGVVSGNTVNGSAVGILNRSLASEVSGNTVSAAHIGLYASTLHGTDVYRSNTISGCVGDGVVVGAQSGGFSDNIITGNGGAGVRFLAPADFGGGASGSTGGNTITGSGGYDVYVEVPAASAAVIYAQGNVWDHSTGGEVEADDIWDGDDDPTLSEVEILPLGS